jgi:hypothetical protein
MRSLLLSVLFLAHPMMGSDVENCAVTLKPIAVRDTPYPGYYGNGKLWVGLWPDGHVRVSSGSKGSKGAGRILPDGTLVMKFPWYRDVSGRLEISGRRVDSPDTVLRANIPDGYGEWGFQASEIVFPTEGCWEITGKIGQANLVFTTFVSRRD